jgi:hypothetical protein
MAQGVIGGGVLLQCSKPRRAFGRAGSAHGQRSGVKPIPEDVIDDVLAADTEAGKLLVGFRLEHLDTVTARLRLDESLASPLKRRERPLPDRAEGRCRNMCADGYHLETSQS